MYSELFQAGWSPVTLLAALPAGAQEVPPRPGQLFGGRTVAAERTVRTLAFKAATGEQKVREARTAATVAQ